MSSALKVGAVVLLAFSLRGADAENNLQKTFTVSPGGKLVIEADRGSLELSLGADDRVEVKVFRKLPKATAARAEEVFAAHEVKFEQQGQEVAVRARFPKGEPGWFRRDSNLQVHYQVSLPRRFGVDLQTSGGAITVPDLTGDVRVRTAGGSLKLGAITGPVWGRTAGGSISLASAKGAVDVETAGGNVKLGSVDGQVRAHTSGGGISVAAATGPLMAKTAGGSIEIGDAGATAVAETSGGSITIRKAAGRISARTAAGGIEIREANHSIDASTSGGSITASLAGQMADDCRLHTAAGSIRLTVPEDLSADLDAHTAAGSVTSDLPVTVQGKQKSDRLQGRLGKGGKSLKLSTSGGSIHLQKR